MKKKTALEKRVEILELDVDGLKSTKTKQKSRFGFLAAFFYFVLWILFVAVVVELGFFLFDGMLFHEYYVVYFNAKPNIQSLVESPWVIDGLEVMTIKRVGTSYIIYGYLGHELSGKTFPLTFVVNRNGDILNRDGLDVVLEFFGATEVVEEDDGVYLIPQVDECHENEDGLWVGCDNDFIKERGYMPTQ